MLALFQGLAVGAGLIIAIGAQNSFIVKQGIKRQHVFLCASICSGIDILLITSGVVGLGELLKSHPLFIIYARWFGAIFLTAYGIRAFYAAFYPTVLDTISETPLPDSAKQTIIVLLGLSLLNPHVYLDTVVLIGSISAQQNGFSRYLFGVGAALASVIWFFTIAYGAQRLSPIFNNRVAWQVLDIIIGFIMLSIATFLILPVILG